MSDTYGAVSPLALFLLPAVFGVVVWFAGRFDKNKILRDVFAVIGTGATFYLALWILVEVMDGRVFFWDRVLFLEVRVDALSAILVALISGIGFLAVIYSFRYMRQQALRERIGQEIWERRLDIFYALVFFFLATMLWGCITDNIVILYVAVEATTIASGLLVAFYLDKRALEAGYKYLMLLTVGITFALFGCVLLYSAASAHLPGESAMLISRMRMVADKIPRETTLLALAFLIVGFGTKAGIAPFHPWLPDAHAEAPTPISALLSGVMLKMAAYALVRVAAPFFPFYHPVSLFIVVLGAFTMILGVLMALVQDDLKRLLAYSSVSQMGYILMGLGIGTYLGTYGGLFHLLNHAIDKALLFLAVGAVIYATGARRISELGGLARRMPVTATCFFIGALAISGMPPFNGFMSKITIFLAGAEAHQWWATGIAMFVSILTLVALVKAAWQVLWSHARDEKALMEIKEVPASIWAPMVALAACCLVLGIYPQLAYPLLDEATKAILPMVRS